ncbi:MAG: hypothetical protein EA425_09270 [Puniceicoccaceae bacterium]|nr:MAG: hypothetical protein EA425_09270 [Puniceicoccaceae bacterium]
MHLTLDMPRQPTDTSCGPTCLHALYRFYGFHSDLPRLIREIPQNQDGGTVSIHLANHALRRGFSAVLYAYNLRIFDPTWWNLDPPELIAKLRKRKSRLRSARLPEAHQGYIDYLELGGELRFTDLTPRLLRRLLARGHPVLTALSLTYLYRSVRELPDGREDDVAGQPVGHFVVLSGYDSETGEAIVTDPLEQNPFNPHGEYRVEVQRLINAVMLGVITYDANLLILTPPAKPPAP